MTLPSYLDDLDALKTYMKRRTKDMPTKDKGDYCAKLVQYVFPLSPKLHDFTQPRLNSKSGSHDKGTDLFSEQVTNEAGALTSVQLDDQKIVMHIQSKWSIDSVDEIEAILSKFLTYAEQPISNIEDKKKGQKVTSNAVQMSFGMENASSKNHYMIATLDRLDTLIREYEKQINRPTRDFYDKLRAQGRLHILDGNEILDILQGEANRYEQRDISIELISVPDSNGWLHWDNVYIGIVSGASIRTLHENFGPSIFFDNIRYYLGNTYEAGETDNDSVNNGIMDTIAKDPDKMLSRNNGIVIRAATVRSSGSSLHIEKMSIVNGCQTTMSIVKSPPEKTDKCYVLVKVVEIENKKDHWDVTRTANMQNEVSRIELDLAQWLRPQLFRSAASEQEKAFQGDDVLAFLSSLGRRSVQYENIRALFIGLFSAAPYNITKRDHNLIQLALVEGVYRADPQGKNLFKTLADLCDAAHNSIPAINRVSGKTKNFTIYERLVDEGKGFISYIALLAACTATNFELTNRISRDRTETSVKAVQEFLQNVDKFLANAPSEVEEYFIAAYTAITTYVNNKYADADSSKLKQHMTRALEQAKFEELIRQTENLYNFRNNK